jgi:hypothetical protein
MPKRQSSNVALPHNLLHAIGHVAAIWAQVEYSMDSAIRRLLDRSEAPAIDTALILPFSKRLKLFGELVNGAFSDETELVAEMIANLKRLKAWRDLIVHGSVRNSAHRRKGRSSYTFARVRWERPAKLIERRYLTVAQVEAIAKEISDVYVAASLFDILSHGPV